MRKFLPILFLCSVLSGLVACHNQQQDHPPKPPKHMPDSGFSAKTTPVGYADACALEYDKLYNPKGPDDEAIENAYTESVGFYGPELLKYLAGVDSLDKREIRIVLGVYVDPDKYNLTAAANQKVNPDDYRDRVGRLTVFVWPFPIGYGHGHGHGGHVGDGCETCAPLNYGTLNP